MLTGARASLARVVRGDPEVGHGAVPGAGSSPQQSVRDAITVWLGSRAPELGSVAACAALAIHPWPDIAIPSPVLQELFDELHPQLNAAHPDPREIAADRLLRLAEVVRYSGVAPAVAAAYESASRELVDAVASDEIRELSAVADALVAPIDPGVVHSAPSDASPAESTSEGIPPEFDTLELLGNFVESVCRSGSLDVGVNLGLGSAGIGVDQLVRSAGGDGPLLAFDRWMHEVEPRVRMLIERRVFATVAPPTLQELGDELGLTRERVRQVESKVRESVDHVFGRALAKAASPLHRAHRYVLPRERLNLLTTLVAGNSEYAPQVGIALREYSGPWVYEGPWVYHESLRAAVASARDSVLGSADEHGLLADDAPVHLDGLFASEDDLLRYFRSALGIVELSGFWSVRDSLRARIAAALKRLGRPATKAEIADAAGLDAAARVGSTLSALPGIIRADKERWAFAGWVDDEYDGIAGEINQRIDAHSGSVAVASLLDELPRKFGVSENSVMIYLQTPAYVVDEGFVRKAEAGSFNAAPPSKWSDAFHCDGAWGQRLKVEQRHLDGYSLKVRFDIAYANGLRPGCDLRVPIEGTSQEASVIWRAHDAAWGIDVGRVSQALNELGFVPGDLVLVLARPTMVSIREPLAEVDVDHDADQGAHSDPLLDLLRDG